MANTRIEGGLIYDAEKAAMQKRDREMIPRVLVYAMFGLALSSLALVSFAVLTDRPLVGVAEPEPLIARHEVILEGEGNASKVTSTDGWVLMDTQHGAFVTVIRSGLTRERLVHRVTGNPPVVIEQYQSGRMTLTDPATGWQVELSSFGAGNRAHFERLFQN